MPRFALGEIQKATGATVSGGAGTVFGDVTTDTRTIEKGALFVALKGERFNGEDFLRQACEAGAAGVLVSDGCPAEKAAGLRDALCETAVAVAGLQMADGSPVRLPLYGERANEFASDQAQNLQLLQEMLAMQTFRRGEDFARVLRMELKRMRRTGAVVIVTTRLDASVVDAVSAIRRMGPSVRFYLVTWKAENEETRPYVTRLQHHMVEVCYVTPA